MVVVVVQPVEADISMHDPEACEGKAYSENNQPECYRGRMAFCVLLSVSIISRAFKLRVV